MASQWTVDWQVLVDGVNVTRKVRPYLISVTVTDQDGEASDSCQITLDDSGGQLKLPRTRRQVQVIADGALLFKGLVDGVRSTCNKSGGRLLKVTAKGFDTEGKAKEPLRLYRDDTTLQAFLSAAAQHAGLSGIKVHQDLASIFRDYWAADTESFLQLGQRLARELNATFKIRGDMAVLVPRGSDAGLGAVKAAYGDNLLSWSVAPALGRPKRRQSRTLFFDRPAGRYQTVDLGIDADADARTETRAAVADRSQAERVNEGRSGQVKREAGQGSLELDFTPAAQAEAPLLLSGTRPGIDGTYVIQSVRHSFDRNGGSGTSIQIKRPESGAGTDERST